MVEAAGVEPASLKPSAQIYYKFSRCYLLAWRVTDKRPTRGWRHFIYTRLLTLPSFFARYRRPSSLTSIQSRTGVRYAATAASSAQPYLARIASASASEGAISTMLSAVEFPR